MLITICKMPSHHFLIQSSLGIPASAPCHYCGLVTTCEEKGISNEENLRTGDTLICRWSARIFLMSLILSWIRTTTHIPIRASLSCTHTHTHSTHARRNSETVSDDNFFSLLLMILIMIIYYLLFNCHISGAPQSIKYTHTHIAYYWNDK